MALPDASTKLRLVLDYVPCEACLAQPVDDQDLLCTLCARLDRQVAVRVGTRTTILLERPAPPAEPVVIPAPEPAAQDAPPAPAPLREVAVRFDTDPETARPGTIEVVVAPLELVAPIAYPVAAPPELVAPVEEEDTFSIDDIATFVSAREEFFDYRSPRPETPVARALEAVNEPLPGPASIPSVIHREDPPVEDDFVFRPPPVEERPPEPRPAIEEEIIPEEEIPVEAPREEQERWAPPPEPDFLAEDNEPVPEEPPPVEEEPLELAPVEDEDEIVETTLVEPEPQPQPEPEEEVVEMEVLPDEEPLAQPTGQGDLYRLRGFSGDAEVALAKAHITEITHLAGHDAGELATRTGLSFTRLVPWIHVADLVHDVGVPVEAANALVAAGVAGPRGLREADADEVADRASAFGGAAVNARDVKRWKRRA